MPNDLYYFYESDLNKGSWTGFVNSLPHHLQEMFKNSMGEGVVGKGPANVLQGYRGPHNNGTSGDSGYLGASNGLQEVRYWWGASKHMNWVPISGWIAYGTCRAIGDTNWHSLYFDSKTGECLSHNKNQATEKLNNKGWQLFQEGKYSEAAKYFNNAYQACSSGYQNEQLFQDNMNHAEAEVLNAEGNRLHNQREYAEAIAKYQAAHSQCPASKTDALNKYKNNEASSLNSQGLELWNNGDYAGAANKFNAAYQKCTNGYKDKQTFKNSIDKAKTEVDAINLNSQVDKLFEQGKYAEAQSKYQEASNKSKVSNQYNKYKANIDKAKYNSVFTDFSLMLTQDITDSELKEFADKLERMIDEGYGSDSEIVNRFHIVCLRIVRKEMNSQLESINREDINDLIEAIMNLIETEIEVLKELNITDQKLEQELKLLEEKLNALDLDNECEQNNNDNILVDITSIASRVEEIEEEVENRASEILAQNTQLEHGGNALELRDPFIASIVETYLMDGINKILQLRISYIEAGSKKQIKLLPSSSINTEINSINLHDVINQLAHETNENKITVIPLLVTTQSINIGNNVNHWVGLISEHRLDEIVVSYLDSENSSLEGLGEYILDVFKVIHPNYKISFREIAVEQQRYNNCGSELIENIILYITGSREDQESAIYLHSSLWEQSLILADIAIHQDKESTLTALFKKTTDIAYGDRECNTNYDDVVSSASEYINLSGFIKYDMENL